MSEWLPSSHLRAIPRVVERVDQVRSFILQETFLFQSLPPSLKATRPVTGPVKSTMENGQTRKEK